MNIYISGSMAYDRIMNFPGVFSDSILPGKIESINVSFMIDRLDENLGGCAGNIAYNLSVLGTKGVIVACVGRDFAHYEKALAERDLSLEGISRCDSELTAGAYIITDGNNNQITAFNPGAMRHSAKYSFENLEKRDIVIVAPGNLTDMQNIPQICKEKNARCIFDPGQQLPVMSGEDLVKAINGSFLLICNDYEMELICKKTGKTLDELAKMAEYAITTLGEKGSRVRHKDQTDFVPAVPVSDVVDPTGAGDAYRSGLLKGLSLNLTVLDSARIGATTAAFCIESRGTQPYFTLDACRKRHQSIFGVTSF
ncbi:carbohydrate kinase [Deltaproteobacteria bacterium]|nr:carbohydrate kinase [Deltaproteobacteria bacterium]